MVDYLTYDKDGLPFIFTKDEKTEDSKIENDTLSNVLLSDTFTVSSAKYEVTLTDTSLIFEPVKLEKKGPIRRLSGLFRSNTKSNIDTSLPTQNDFVSHHDIRSGQTYSKSSRRHSTTSVQADVFGGVISPIPIAHIYRVTVQHKKVGGQLEAENGRCLGFVIHYAEQKVNKWKQRVLAIGHSDDDTCTMWTNQIEQIMQGQHWRPHKVKVILQPLAGNKDSRFHYRSKIDVLLKLADITYDILDLQEKRDLVGELADCDLNDYDCFLCVGGDGTVSKVINAILNMTQQNANKNLHSGITPQRPSVSIGIVPFGSTNQIAMSVTGSDDPMTGALHAILGHHTAVDITSVYHADTLIRWCFVAQYGFPANVVDFSKRYKFMGHHKMLELGFMKAVSKAKLKKYKCDIEYVPSGSVSESNTNDGVICYTGCNVCEKKTDDTGCRVEDLVEVLDPLAISSTSSTIMDLTSESTWRTSKGDYLSISLVTLPTRSHFAPQGLSKYSHLSDGCLDILLVKQVERKQFIRHLKRHGTGKNQLDFPFIEAHRAKEVRFRARLPITWNYKDYDYSEIDYEMTRAAESRQSHDSIHVVDLDSDDGILDDDDDVSDLEISDTESMTHKTPSPRSRSSTESPPAVTLPKPRLSFTEIEVRKRRDKKRKKEEKRKSRDEDQSRSQWCLDTELIAERELQFVVHQGLVTLCGLGVHPDTVTEEVSMRCLPL